MLPLCQTPPLNSNLLQMEKNSGLWYYIVEDSHQRFINNKNTLKLSCGGKYLHTHISFIINSG